MKQTTHELCGNSDDCATVRRAIPVLDSHRSVPDPRSLHSVEKRSHCATAELILATIDLFGFIISFLCEEVEVTSASLRLTHECEWVSLICDRIGISPSSIVSWPCKQFDQMGLYSTLLIIVYSLYEFLTGPNNMYRYAHTLLYNVYQTYMYMYMYAYTL